MYSSKMNLPYFFDKLVEQYQNAKATVSSYERPDVFRGRQHDISSIAEDMFAALVSDTLNEEFPDTKLYFRVDYPMRTGKGSKMFPDIAIIVEAKKPILVSYLDLKIDLGYNRKYYEQFETIKNHVNRLRTAEDAGAPTWEESPRAVVISKSIKWRTIVLTDCNMSPRSLLQENKDAALQYNDYFKLYFLSGKSHPNEKHRELINIYQGAFSELIHDLKEEINLALRLSKVEEEEVLHIPD